MFPLPFPPVRHRVPSGSERAILDWDGWLTPLPGCFTPGEKTRYTLFRRLSGPQGRSGRGVGCESGVGAGISPVPGFDLWTSEPVGICYLLHRLLYPGPIVNIHKINILQMQLFSNIWERQ